MPRRSPMVICPGGARCRRRFGRSRADRPFPHPWGPNPAGQSMRRAAYARHGVRGLLPHPRFAGQPDRVPPSRAGPVRPSPSPRDLSRQDPWQLPDRIGAAPGASVTDAASPAPCGVAPGAWARTWGAVPGDRRAPPWRAGNPWLPRRKRTGRRRMPYARAAQSSLTGSRHPDPPRRTKARTRRGANASMTKRMLIDASHAEETRVVVLDGDRLEEFDLEAATKRPLKGNIYLAKVVRVEPSLQAAFVEYGGNRQASWPSARSIRTTTRSPSPTGSACSRCRPPRPARRRTRRTRTPPPESAMDRAAGRERSRRQSPRRRSRRRGRTAESAAELRRGRGRRGAGA